ncbi:RRNA methylase [Thecamonas trahens ATCC 50062]|uniref:rRNA methylase n=1 Tax=Thecamonas trahens ATCC 50062 TaxID=461836 RepID=A0A0L0D9Z3_THETB|nr:RRNA methylase [Thecamonas trahens ATCC 50062]KNC48911.1 RRNA methylase [Thecamonas trahens ATCC 50062]|eukprot:XP_013758328.1 RRNA methylase [Thecamonas trahens ATCC 50062]
MWRRVGLSARQAVAALSPYLSDTRRRTLEGALRGRTEKVRLVLENVANPRNAGAALRTAEGVGVHHVDIVADEDHFDHAFRSQSAARWLGLRRFDAAADMLAAPPFDASSTLLLTAELSPTARPLPLWREDLAAAIHDDGKTLALAFGNERLGVSSELSAAAHGAFVLPLRGMTQSFNISVAVGMTMAYLQAWGLLSDAHFDARAGLAGSSAAELTAASELTDAQAELLATWYTTAVGHAPAILERAAEAETK